MSALSVQVPFPVFTGTDGTPLENGYVWIGQANTNPKTSPVVVFFNQDLTIVAPQPIRTTAGYPTYAGSPSKLYINGENFSIRVEDKNGVLVYSDDDATGISPNALGIDYDPDASSLFPSVKISVEKALNDLSDESAGSSLVGFLQDGTGAEARTVQSKLRETVSFKDFGAIGNGIVNDTSDIQAAVNTQKAISIDDSTYLSNQINIDSNLSIEGAGFDSVIQQGSLASNYVLGNAGNKSKLVLSKIVLDGNKTLGTFTGSGHGLDLTGYDEVFIDTIVVRNCTNHGIRLRTGCEKVYINNVVVHDNDSYGITFEDVLTGSTSVSEVMISKIHAYNNGTPSNRYSGVNFGDTSGTLTGPRKILIGEIYAHDNERDGVAFGRNATSGYVGAQEISVGAIYAIDNNDHGVEFFGCRNIQIGSILAKGNAKHGVYITTGDDGNTLSERIQIGRVISEENGYHGVYIAAAKHISIDSIIARDNSQDASNTYDGVHIWPGAVADYSPGDTLENIYIGSLTALNSTLSVSQRYGFRLQSGQEPAGGLYIGSFYGDNNNTADLSTNAWAVLNNSFTLSIGNIQKCSAIEPTFSDNLNGGSLKTAVFKVDGEYVARGQTNTSFAANLARIPIKNNALGIIEAWIYGKDSTNATIAAYKLIARVNSTGSITSIVSSTTVLTSETNVAMDASLVSGGAGTLFVIVSVTGVGATVIDWECRASVRYNNELGA
jgi:hypothetical protein